MLTDHGTVCNFEYNQKQRRMIRDVAESVESLTTDSPVDHEKHEIQEIKEKIQGMATVQDMEEDDTILAEEVLTATETETVHVPSVEEKRVEMEKEFDLKEDTMEFVEDEAAEMDREIELKQEIKGREKTRKRVSHRIEKFLEKTSKKADETSTTFGNTLKSIDNLDHLSEDEFVSMLQEVDKNVLKLGYSDEQYGEFWKLYKARRVKHPDSAAWEVLEHIMIFKLFNFVLDVVTFSFFQGEL